MKFNTRVPTGVRDDDVRKGLGVRPGACELLPSQIDPPATAVEASPQLPRLRIGKLILRTKMIS